MRRPISPCYVLLVGARAELGRRLTERLLTVAPVVIYQLLAEPPTCAVSKEQPSPSRLNTVIGDISQVTLGLSRSAYDALAETVDLILHCPSDDVCLHAAHLATFAERHTELTGRGAPLVTLRPDGHGIQQVDRGHPDRPVPDFLEAMLEGVVGGLQETTSAPNRAAARRLQHADGPTLRIDGIAVPGTVADWTELPSASLACEREGFGAFWVAEERHDPLLALSRAAEVTSAVELGSAITVALARSPMTLAYTANDVQQQSRGRLILGLGSQVPANIVHRFGMPADRPVARMREFVLALKEIWRSWNEGTPLAFRGEIYQFTLMQPRFSPQPNPYGPPRIMLAAIGPRMAQIAAEVADGLITPPFSTQRHLTEVVLPAVERGLAKSGRPRGSFSIVCMPPVITGDSAQERADSRTLVAQLVAGSLGVASYRHVFELDGLGWLNDELVTLSTSADPQRWAKIVELIDTHFLELVTVDESPQQVGDALRRRFAGLVDRLILPAPGGPFRPGSLNLDVADPRVRRRFPQGRTEPED